MAANLAGFSKKIPAHGGKRLQRPNGHLENLFKSADIQIPRVCFKSDQPNVSGNTWEQWRRRWETRHKE
jgi:hypothetical protein